MALAAGYTTGYESTPATKKDRQFVIELEKAFAPQYYPEIRSTITSFWDPRLPLHHPIFGYAWTKIISRSGNGMCFRCLKHAIRYTLLNSTIDMIVWCDCVAVSASGKKHAGGNVIYFGGLRCDKDWSDGDIYKPCEYCNTSANPSAKECTPVPEHLVPYALQFIAASVILSLGRTPKYPFEFLEWIREFDSLISGTSEGANDFRPQTLMRAFYWHFTDREPDKKRNPTPTRALNKFNIPSLPDRPYVTEDNLHWRLSFEPPASDFIYNAALTEIAILFGASGAGSTALGAGPATQLLNAPAGMASFGPSSALVVYPTPGSASQPTNTTATGALAAPPQQTSNNAQVANPPNKLMNGLTAPNNTASNGNHTPNNTLVAHNQAAPASSQFTILMNALQNASTNLTSMGQRIQHRLTEHDTTLEAIQNTGSVDRKALEIQAEQATETTKNLDELLQKYDQQAQTIANQSIEIGNLKSMQLGADLQATERENTISELRQKHDELAELNHTLSTRLEDLEAGITADAVQRDIEFEKLKESVERMSKCEGMRLWLEHQDKNTSS